jgi:beta-galactosidase
MVEYWHWSSIPSGQEVYWKGVLGHDLEPNRVYAEVSRTAHELQKIGPQLANMKITNQVAILYSIDSWNGLNAMPFAHQPPVAWHSDLATADYVGLVRQFHHVLYNANIGCDFVFPEDPDFSRYKVLIVPALYVADDALLQKISDYVKQGGHVLMTFKSGFTNENNAIRWVRAPGPLREAAGFSYQEFSNLEKPLALKGDPYKAGDENQVMYWAEFLMPNHAKTLATYDHPFYGQWPAITQNQYGSGTLTYEGTFLSNTLQKAVVLDVLRQAGLTGPAQQLPPAVREKDGVSASGKNIHYYLNYSGNPQTFAYSHGSGSDLLTGKTVASSDQLTIGPWDLAIIEEP